MSSFVYGNDINSVGSSKTYLYLCINIIKFHENRGSLLYTSPLTLRLYHLLVIKWQGLREPRGLLGRASESGLLPVWLI